MKLDKKKRMAAEILKAGVNRVWIDPERIDDAEAAITREEVRKLIHEGIVKPAPQKGVSRSRARVLHRKKKQGLRTGPGSRTGALRAKISKKRAWINRIRAQRKKLRELKAKKIISEGSYRDLYSMASSGRFSSIGDLERYAKAHDLWRKR